MRNIFLFIRRHSNFIFFLLLQGFCLYLIVHYNRYQNAVTTAYMTGITGKINTQYDKVEDYLHLKNENKRLAQENEGLRNHLRQNFESPDTLTKIVTDSIPYDTLGNHRKWLYKMAKVVLNNVTTQENYIELSRGANQQMRKDVGIVDPNNGVVGIVTDVSDNFSVVMSLLHKDSKISAKLKKGGDVGMVTWDGKDPNRLTLNDIRKSAKIAKGDTVFTSGYTATFPYGMLIGTVDQVVPDKSTNNYLIKLKSAANFYNLQYVYAIDNLQKEEMNKLLEKVKKQNQ
ncbi:MAG: rod shape-determining protein MreC [Bacteroidota bacterium]